MSQHHSLSLLHSFVIVAEEKNLSRASDILHITPSAVSHQMKRLEQQLDIKLLERKSKGIALTESGMHLYKQIKQGMNIIDTGLSQVVSKQKPAFIIAAVPSFIELILIPNMKGLKACFPDLPIELVALDKIADFSNTGVDCHIHFGDGQYSGAAARHLYDEWLYPAVHPELVAPNLSFEKILTSLSLIDYRGGVEDKPGAPNWHQWLKTQGHLLPSPQVTLTMNNVAMTMAAAQQQQGVFLARHQLCAQHLSQAFISWPDKAVKTAFSYYLAAPVDRWNDEKLLKLHAWLLTLMEAKP